MYTYQIIKNDFGIELILRSDGAWIPSDPANSDYQAYLAYVVSGNTLPSNSSDPVEAEKPKK